jgi:hypothetical protein
MGGLCIICYIVILSLSKDEKLKLMRSNIKQITTDAQTQRTLVIFALMAALGVLSVQVVDIVTFLQAEAKGCPLTSLGSNVSKTRCVK